MEEKIFAVCMTLKAGTDYHKEVIARNNIQVGKKYEVTNVEVGDWVSFVQLVGYKDEFNTVFFKFVDENDNLVDIYSNPAFRDEF